MANMIIGIDIGTNQTKVVAFEQAAKLHLIKAVAFPTPLETLRDGTRRIRPEEFSKNLSDRIPLKILKSAKIATNLPASGVSALSIFLPLMSRKELMFVSVNEAKQKMIPATSSEHVFESLYLGEVTVANVPKAEALVIRTEKKHIENALSLFRSVESIPSLITPNSSVIGRVIPKEVWDKEENVIFIDIGANSITIAISRHTQLVFMRNVVFGYSEIVADITRQLGVTEAEAEKAIQEQGIPQVPFDLKDKVAIAEEIMRQKYEESLQSQEANKSAVNALELRMLWQPHLERIIQELRRSLIFYKEQAEGKRIEQIYFLGGVSQVNNFLATIIAQIGGKCQLALPFADPAITAGQDIEMARVNTPLFSNAASLALSIPDIKAKEPLFVNFLPLDLRKREETAKRQFIILISAVVLSSIVSLILLKTVVSNAVLKRNIKQIDFQLIRVKRSIDRLQDLKQKDSLLEQRRSEIAGLSGEKGSSLALLEKIRKAVAGEVVLRTLDLAKNKLEIKAMVYADYEQADAIIKEFQSALEKIQSLKNIIVTPAVLEDIVPLFGAKEGDVRLTKVKPREFTINAEVGN